MGRNRGLSPIVAIFAKKNDMDLIVVGGRGLGLVEGFLLGSISREVLEQAHCPVLVVK